MTKTPVTKAKAEKPKKPDTDIEVISEFSEWYSVSQTFQQISYTFSN